MHELRNETIIEVSCGNSVTIALSINGEIFQWGKGEFSTAFPLTELPSVMEAVHPKRLQLTDSQGKKGTYLINIGGEWRDVNQTLILL